MEEKKKHSERRRRLSKKKEKREREGAKVVHTTHGVGGLSFIFFFLFSKYSSLIKNLSPSNLIQFLYYYKLNVKF